ncbi:MAG TPA: hypothetical protein V6C97_09525 [Oculatellaceae cyanobacterium]
MDTEQFVKEKRGEILALATRHKVAEIRAVLPDDTVSAEGGVKFVAKFGQDVQRSAYFDAIVEFQEDLESWLGVPVHVYDANGFKGDDGEAFLAKTIAV